MQNKKMIKILIVAPQWENTYINTNLGKLILSLNLEASKIIFYCKNSPSDSDFISNFPDVKLLNFRYSGSLKGVGLFKFFYNTARLLLFNKPDLVLWSYVGYAENFIFALLGIPYILKTDSHQMSKPNSFLSSIRYKLFVEYPIKKADHVLVETDEVGERIKSVIDRDVYFFPNGVPIKKFIQYEEEFKSRKARYEQPYILYTGRIMREKGVDLLLESFNKISHKHPEWKLYIVGSVWEEDYDAELRKFVSDNNLHNNVVFLPFKTGIDLYELYYFAEFFVLPSRHEGLANRITEAMYFNNAIIAFDINQTKALVTEQTGMLIKPFDINFFAQQMLLLMESSEIRKTKGDCARSVVVNGHNDDKLFIELFEKIGLH